MDGCSPRSASIRPTRTLSTRSVSGSMSRRMAAGPSRRSRTRVPSTAIITGCGWTPKPASHLQRERRRLLSDLRRRSDLEVRGSAGGSQFYNLTVDNSSPAWVYGSIQDVGSRRGRLDLSQGRDKIAAVDFENAPGGEGSFQAVDPVNPNVVYSHGFYGNFTRDDLSVPPASAGAAVALPRRGAFDSTAGAAAQHEHPSEGGEPSRPVDGAGRGVAARPRIPLYLSDTSKCSARMTAATTWEKISGDLTGNDPAQTLPKSSSEIPYQTITALAESPRVKGLIYAGTDDGRLQVTTDDGENVDRPDRQCPERKSGTHAWFRLSTRIRRFTSRNADGRTMTLRSTSTSRRTAARRSRRSRPTFRPVR